MSNSNANFFNKIYKKNINNKDQIKNDIPENIIPNVVIDKDINIVAPERLIENDNLTIEPTGDVIEKESSNKERQVNETSNDSTNEVQVTVTEEKKKEKQIEVPVTINIEDEEKDLPLQIKIIDTIERIINVDLYELENIKFKLEILNDKQDEEVNTEELEKLKEVLQDIIKKFDKIREKYKDIPFDSSTELQIEDDDLLQLIEEYKNVTEENIDNKLLADVNKQIKEVEEYVGVIETLLRIEDDKDSIEETLNEKIEKFGIRDEDFEQMQKDYSNIDRISEDIERFCEEQNKVLKDLEYKIANSEKITKKVETEMNIVTDFSKVISATIMFAAAKKIPSTPAGIILKTSLFLGAVNALSNIVQVEEKEKIVTNISYTNYVNDIKASINNIDSMINHIDVAQNDIDNMMIKFKKDFKEYSSFIPEYDELFKNIEKTQKILNEQKDIARKHKKDFDNTLVKNNTKVKRLEEMKNNEVVR